MNQQIRFCRTADGVNLAYALSGSGPDLVKSAHWLTHLDHDWNSPIWRHQHEGLSRHFRFLRYDQRGAGLSDRNVNEMSLAHWVSDLETVVDSAGMERFVLLGMSQGGSIAIEYALRHPERVSHLVLFGSYGRGRRLWDGGEDSEREAAALSELIHVGWGLDNPAYRQLFSSLFIPEATPTQIRHFNELQRLSASAHAAAAIVEVTDRLDVEEAAQRLEVPTLVMHCDRDQRIPFAEGRRLAALIPGARFVPLNGSNHIMQEGDASWNSFLDEFLHFTDTRKREDTDSGERLADLTDRERAVLSLLATGAGNDQIAERLHLAPKTVRNYVSRLFDKLGVSSRGEAIVVARESGLGVTRPER
jgi:pimeloyl-ACP methyl ester carboxylesterase/DNA-binding CsgD family transcriptional regulator